MPVQHADLPVYQIVILRAMRGDGRNGNIWQDLSLAGLRASRGEKSGFCTGLHDLLYASKAFNSIDRICVARQIAGSNQLEVLDVFSHTRLGTNPMLPGYRCVVDPTGSLMQLNAAQMRVFHDATRVCDSYRTQGRPVQRSIGLVGRLGLRSGLCLPLFQGGHRQGFLFMNSADPGVFDQLDDAQCGMLILAQQLAIRELLAGGFQAVAEPVRAIPCLAQELAHDLRAVLASAHGITAEVVVAGIGDRFFLAPGHFLDTAIAAIAAGWDQHTTPALTMDFLVVGNRLRIHLRSAAFGPAPFAELRHAQAQAVAASFRFDLSWPSAEEAVIDLPYDPVQDGVAYSV